MSEKKREENNIAPEDEGNPSPDEDEQPSLDMGAEAGTAEPDPLDRMGAVPGTPITVGGDG